MSKCLILVDNNASIPFVSEHGLALLIEHNGNSFLFDTGAGEALVKNSKLLGVDIACIDKVVLSHGHNDHTGGVASLGDCKIYARSGIDIPRFSIHKDTPVRNISMPANSVEKLHKSDWIHSDTFNEIFDGVFSSGKILRESDEDTGGPFFIDDVGTTPDLIEDEQALLLSSGMLVQGCCHAGIINTMEHFKRCCPDIEITSIIGGLHLLNASEKRLLQTANYLNKSNVKDLYLLHCTGHNAIAFLKQQCKEIRIHISSVGEFISCYDNKK